MLVKICDVPAAPRPRTLDLPPEPSSYLCINQKSISSTSFSHDSPEYPVSNSLYPISLISTNLTPQQRIGLQNIDLHLPLHVHTPTTHVGMILSDNIDGCMHELINAAVIFELLRTLASVPLEPRSLFLGLHPAMVPDVFQARISRPSRTSHLIHCDTMGSRFFYGGLAAASANSRPCVNTRVVPSISPLFEGCPLGRDLLLGNCNVWGFETASFNGCDIVHIA